MSLTKCGHVKVTSLLTVCQWVKKAWNEVSQEIVEQSFKKCDISNAIDGTEDDTLWKDDLTAENETSENGEHEELNLAV